MEINARNTLKGRFIITLPLRFQSIMGGRLVTLAILTFIGGQTLLLTSLSTGHTLSPSVSGPETRHMKSDVEFRGRIATLP